ncbi:MAG: 23S rRNA (uracil(1939)-C(5))-methyltransferase RlmD [Desulfovibrionaceae bacterium]|nr:23S rRNA (uracil(1939)-C(5))-methyltransferase RlmD [Desulfovibrionaceae bacterium]
MPHFSIRRPHPSSPSRPCRSAPASICPNDSLCGGCRFISEPYPIQLCRKQNAISSLLAPFAVPDPIFGMDHPFHYRNKIEKAFGTDKSGRLICGNYRAGSRDIVPNADCIIEDEAASAILADIANLADRFRLQPYNEKTGRGFLRHVLIRCFASTGEILVALVVTSPIFKAGKHFVADLLARHPQIRTVVLNINSRRTSMVLGDEERVLYGPGFIQDILCGCRFRVSARSFYQVNSLQTEKLYQTAIRFAGLSGSERVLDAYCGAGTIGLAAARSARSVLGVELNPAAVRDAIVNADLNGIRNARFIAADAGRFMLEAATDHRHFDVVFLDPPRSGCSDLCRRALIRLRPWRIVYVSCCPETLARDLADFCRNGYTATAVQPVDMFPHTEHLETIVLLKPDSRR